MRKIEKKRKENVKCHHLNENEVIFLSIEKLANQIFDMETDNIICWREELKNNNKFQYPILFSSLLERILKII